MTEQDYLDWAQDIAKKNDFTIGKKIYAAKTQGGHYRNLILDGTWQGKPAVLKMYDDYRITDEPVSLQAFLKNNTSTILRAPALYAWEMVTAKKGWLIIEHLPEGAEKFAMPMAQSDRQLFLQLYREYRHNFPTQPTRPLMLAEQLPAHEFHIVRINRWFEAANSYEAENVLKGLPTVLDPKEFLPRWSKAQELIWDEFQGRPIFWGHGHFKPHELFRVPNSAHVYLIDFAHSVLYPQGHELAFMIWADHLIGADWQQPYSTWKAGFDQWLEDVEPIAQEFGYGGQPRFMATNLVERILGTILADVTTSDMPREEKVGRLSLLYQLLDDLL